MKAALIRLVRLFPAPFRDRFGAAMVDDITADYDLARARGRADAAWFAVTTALDLLRSAIAEHARPTWTRTSGIHANTSGTAGWLTDLRIAARSLRRAPGFTTVSIGTLGLAIGATAAMFAVVDSVLLNPLPYSNVDRVVDLTGTAPGSGMPREFALGGEFYLQYKEQSKLLEDIAVYTSFTNTLRVGDRVERVEMSWPTNSLFSTLGAKPILGRAPVAADETNAVVLSYSLWTSWFGRDSSVIGRSIDVYGQPRTIVGVMGAEFDFPTSAQLWISSELRTDNITVGRFRALLLGRMKPGVTTDELSRELTGLSKRLPERFGGSAAYARIIDKHHVIVRTIKDSMFGSIAKSLWVLLVAAAVVLLIACANVANLFMVRADGRQRDLAVRRAIGAARGALIRSQMAEAVVVAGFAGVVAVGLAWTGLPMLLRFAPENVPRLANVRVGALTLAFTLGVAFFVAIACGLVPAIRASSPDLRRLREGGRGSTRNRTWARDGLVVAQTALALVLLIGSGLLIRSFTALRRVDPGFRTENVFTFQIAPSGAALKDGPSFARFDLEFMDRLRALPGVESVGLVENVPLDEGTTTSRFRTEESSDPDGETVVDYTFMAGDYFRTMGIEVLRGRSLEVKDHVDNLRNVVISRTAANLLWPGKDPVGRRLQRQGLTSWETVVGVVEDVKQNGLRDGGQALLYYPLVGPTPTSWVIASPAYVVKTARATTIAADIRALVREVAPRAPMYRVHTMDELARKSVVQLSFTLLMLGFASSLALILGAVGLYGVLSYVVAQRTREIGVRMALGAQASSVRRMVVVQGTRVVVAGVAIGIAVALAFTRWLESLLFGVKAVDAATFAAMSVCMLGIGFLASYVPAVRASRVDPIESLRGD